MYNIHHISILKHKTTKNKIHTQKKNKKKKKTKQKKTKKQQQQKKKTKTKKTKKQNKHTIFFSHSPLSWLRQKTAGL